MERSALEKFSLPDAPGVYLFKKGRKVLYVGKATSLRDRVRSYFDDNLIETRGVRIVDMVTNADRVAFETTPTVLEALVREAVLIKKYLPKANVEGKDDSTFLYTIITKEDIPRVLIRRGKDINFEKQTTARGESFSDIYGPFPSRTQLREGLRLIQRIFPFFDTDKPLHATGKYHASKIEFNRQIGQYPKAIDAAHYRASLRNVKLFLAGRANELRHKLTKEMEEAAASESFEEAIRYRHALFALDHVQDVALVKDEQLEASREKLQVGRIEAYDTAHLAGTNAVGVMVVLEDGELAKKEYRTFHIRGVKKNDDVGSLREILSRRLRHTEWLQPNAIVVDGSAVQKRAAEKILREAGFSIPVVAVVKDERHRPREVIGANRAHIAEADAVLVNAEAHRFSLARHRKMRSRNLKTGK